VKERLAKIEAYGKAHWKELLALVLAAIPAGFLLFHKGTQKAAANVISYIPAAFGGGSGAASSADPGAALADALSTGPPPSSTLGTSVNGSNPTNTPAIPRTGGSSTPKTPPPPPPAPNTSYPGQLATVAAFAPIQKVLGGLLPGILTPAPPAPVSKPKTIATILRYVAPAPAPAPAPVVNAQGQRRSSGGQIV
jgi:hypothetical protein